MILLINYMKLFALRQRNICPDPQKSVQIMREFSRRICDQNRREVRMRLKRYTAEQIIGMLQEAEVELSRGEKINQAGGEAGYF